MHDFGENWDMIFYSLCCQIAHKITPRFIMSIALLTVIAVLGYLASSALILRQVRDKRDVSIEKTILSGIYLPAVAAWTIHMYLCVAAYRAIGGVDFSVSGMMVLVSAILSGIFLLGCLFMPIRRLGILMFPLSALSLGFAYTWNSEVDAIVSQGGAMNTHILISVVAYSLLTIATVQALLYLYQERQIKKRTNPALLIALPPLQTMEQLLFRLITAGFVLLTVTLLSGALFSQQIFGQAFEFKHHTVLALMGWTVFATLLFNRVKNGLRGSQAAVWTVAGFLLIQLGYFGTKIVTESLNIN